MAGVHLIALICAVVTISLLVEMLRRRQIRQKYAITWMVVGMFVAIVAISPELFNRIAHSLGVINPPDLLIVLSALFLLLVTVHMSWELGRLEDRSRMLAQEVALLRCDLEAINARAEPAGAVAPVAARAPIAGTGDQQPVDEPGTPPAAGVEPASGAASGRVGAPVGVGEPAGLSRGRSLRP